nr:PAS domain-containing protein [candidate division Zixibacteria bacterium]
MNDQSSKFFVEKTNLCKCPVFKIDLNGRFVYVDDLTENLLGVPSEQLFGRSIEEYLDYESYAALLSIMHSGKHYETSFQAMTMTFLDVNRKQRHLDVIISLNFIAGNPANYQVIINVNRCRGSAFVSSDSDNTDADLPHLLFDFVAGSPDNPDWEMLCEIFMELPDISQVGIYFLKENSLSLLGSVSRTDIDNPVDLKEASESLLKAACEGKTFIKPDSMEVVSADEIIYGGTVDISYPLMSREKAWGLLRVIHNGDHSLLESQISPAVCFLGKTLHSALDISQPGPVPAG